MRLRRGWPRGSVRGPGRRSRSTRPRRERASTGRAVESWLDRTGSAPRTPRGSVRGPGRRSRDTKSVRSQRTVRARSPAAAREEPSPRGRAALSSNVARNAPARPDGAPARFAAADASSRTAFLTEPRMPDTVLIAAPSNLAASSADVNMPSTNAVFFSTRYLRGAAGRGRPPRPDGRDAPPRRLPDAGRRTARRRA